MSDSREKRYDPSREYAEAGNRSAIRWFYIYTSWTDVYPIYPAPQVITDQFCYGLHAHWNENRTQWVSTTSIMEKLWDPKLTSKPTIGTLIRAHFNPENGHWEVFPGAAAQNYVEYSLDVNLNGFLGTTNFKLDATHLNGWPGSYYRAGSEAAAKIQYQTAEVAPQTHGLFKVLADGLYRITLNVSLSYSGPAFPSAATQATVTTGAASAGTAHTHDVVQTGQDAYLGDADASPILHISLFNKKASGGANAVHANAVGNFYQWWTGLRNIVGGTDSAYIPLCAQWNVCLSLNDKISLKWTLDHANGHTVICKESNPVTMRIEYIGDKADWAVIT